MSEITDWISAFGSAGSAIFTGVAACGVLYAHKQLRNSREIAQLQFEDGLAREYRELASAIPTKALLGEILSETEYNETFDQLFRYIDLSNEQVCLRQRNRISLEVWWNWRDGIRNNLSLPAFQKAWQDIKARSTSFQELRRLEVEKFENDPSQWNGE